MFFFVYCVSINHFLKQVVLIVEVLIKDAETNMKR
jgi:hypothetical protein